MKNRIEDLDKYLSTRKKFFKIKSIHEINKFLSVGNTCRYNGTNLVELLEPIQLLYFYDNKFKKYIEDNIFSINMYDSSEYLNIDISTVEKLFKLNKIDTNAEDIFEFSMESTMNIAELINFKENYIPTKDKSKELMKDILKEFEETIDKEHKALIKNMFHNLCEVNKSFNSNSLFTLEEITIIQLLMYLFESKNFNPTTEYGLGLDIIKYFNKCNTQVFDTTIGNQLIFLKDNEYISHRQIGYNGEEVIFSLTKYLNTTTLEMDYDNMIEINVDNSELHLAVVNSIQNIRLERDIIFNDIYTEDNVISTIKERICLKDEENK